LKICYFWLIEEQHAYHLPGKMSFVRGMTKWSTEIKSIAFLEGEIKSIAIHSWMQI
jgi:hypothetical protein